MFALSLLLAVGLVVGPEATDQAEVQRALQRALPLLQKTATVHAEKKTCFGCHNQGPPVMALALADRRGFPLADAFRRTQREHVIEFVSTNRELYAAGKGTGGAADTAGTLLMALEQTGHKADENTSAVVEYLLQFQADKDHWSCGSNRPPSEASHFTTTYMAIRALKAWGSPEQQVRAEKKLAQARTWLERTAAKETEDRVFRLLALALVKCEEKHRIDAIRELREAQAADGGWAQRSDMTSDAYATGTALFALHEAGGMKATDPVYQKGLGFLLKTQLADGSWKVTSRSKPFQTYYESGFPHEKNQFISASASGWATLALLLACPTGDGPSTDTWLKPQEWRRDRDAPALGLGDKGQFDDQHIFAPHVISMDGEYWMYYSGSQRCVDAGTYKGKAKDPAHPEKSDQRLFKLGLAKSKDGVTFTRTSTAPAFSFGDDIHSVVTAAILKNSDGSVCREKGKLRMYFAAVDFPGGTYKHDLYETTSVDGLRWEKPTRVMENAYAPCVIKEGDRYRMWYTWIDKHPWHTNYAESTDGTRWTIREKPCIVMDQKWEVKDQVYPMVLKADGVYLMVYGCYYNDDKHTALGFAVSRDGLTWTKHPDNPVFRPEPKNDWESNFTTSHTLLRLPDGSFRLWYAGRKQPPWSNLYFAIGTAHWKGPEK